MLVVLHFGIHVVICNTLHMYICCTNVAYCLLLALVAMGSSCMLMSCHRCCQGSFRYVQLAGWRNGSPQPSPRGLREGPGIEIQD